MMVVTEGERALAPVPAPSPNLQKLAEVADGAWDLTVRLDEKGGGSQVARLLNRIFGHFAQGITEATRAGTKLYENVPQLFQLAGSLESTSKTQENHASTIAGSARQMAEHLHGITDSMEQALDFTDRVGGIVAELEVRSHQIEDVVGLVRRVASQTKLLSLNASVEAARAGQAGRAFGVVAEEIQRLAMEAASATDRIHEVLHSLEAQIRDAVRAVGARGTEPVAGETTLTRLMEHAVHLVRSQDEEVVRVARDIEKIADDARAQSVGAAQLKGLAARAQEGSDQLIVSLGVFRLPAHTRPRELIGRLADDPAFAEPDRATRENAMRQTVGKFPFVELLYITDAAGKQVTDNIAAPGFTAAYGSSGHGRDWSQRPWYLEPLRTGTLYISDIYRSSATDRFCFTISSPLYDARGELSGVLGADIDLTQLL